MTFHGQFNQGGLANEENPLAFVDLATGGYFHFIANTEVEVGHIDGILAAGDSLYLSDLSDTGKIFSSGENGVLYQILSLSPPVAPELPALAPWGVAVVALALGLAGRAAARRRPGTLREDLG